MRLALDDGEPRRAAQLRLHGPGIELAVRLRPRSADRRSLAAVEETELNPGPVGDSAHKAIERIDFADEMPFSKTADGRIAGHRPDGVRPVRDEGGARSEASGRGCGFGAGMTTAHDDHLEPIQEV